MMKLKIILTGASGMVGEGVLLACLADPRIEEVLCVGRKGTGRSHIKLKEYIVPDFLSIKRGDENLKGYDACFYCAGVSSVGMDENTYTHITYDITLHFAKILIDLNPELTFNFVSGSHTDSSEKGKVMWARIKGRTENALIAMPFKGVYCFRPGLMKVSKGQQNLKGANKVVKLIYPILNLFFPASTLQDMGLAMIHAVLRGYPQSVLEVADINILAKP